MLSSLQLARLTEGSAANRALCGGFLPTNNNAAFISFEDIATVTIVDSDGRTPIAFGAVNKYSSKQAYCMIAQVSKKYENSTVWLRDASAEKANVVLRVARAEKGKPNHTGEGAFAAVFGEHDGRSVEEFLMERIVEHSVGNSCLDLSKNVTLDVLGAENLAGWRDNAGFIVTDNQKYLEVTCEKSQLAALSGASATEITVIDAANLEAVLEFDAQCATFDRSEFLAAIAKIAGLRGALALDSQKQPLGYVLTLGARVLCCYAECDETARQLLSFAASNVAAEHITFFAALNAQPFMDALIRSATHTTPVERLHTRTLIKQVKWRKVFCANIGLSVF